MLKEDFRRYARRKLAFAQLQFMAKQVHLKPSYVNRIENDEDQFRL